MRKGFKDIFSMSTVFLVSQPWIKTELTETDFELSFSAKRRVALDW
jgi:hypothetical protein